MIRVNLMEDAIMASIKRTRDAMTDEHRAKVDRRRSEKKYMRLDTIVGSDAVQTTETEHTPERLRPGLIYGRIK